MKKIIALVLCFLMFFSVSAYAEGYDILFAEMKSGSVNMNLTLTCDNPEVLKEFKELLGMTPVVNGETLIGGFFDITANSEMNFSVNDDYTDIRFSVILDCFVPVNLNSNLSLSAKARVAVWGVYDVTDESNPVIKLALSMPAGEKYIVVDVIQELCFRGADKKVIARECREHFNKDTVSEYMTNLKKVYEANSTLTSDKEKVVITISDDQYYSFIKDVYSMMYDVMEDALPADVVASGFPGDPESAVDEMAKYCDISIEAAVTPDKNNMRQTVDTKTFLSVNVPAEEETTINIQMTLTENASYSNVNQPIDIPFPELTDDNSVPYYKMSGYTYDSCGWLRINGSYVPAAEGTFYVPFGAVLTNLRDGGHEYSIDISDGVVVLTALNNSEKFETLRLTVGSNQVEMDSETFAASNPAIYVDNVLYVDNTVFEKAFNMLYPTAEINLLDNTISVKFERDCPMVEIHYEEESYDYYDDEYYSEYGEEYEYCWHYENLWIPVDYPDFDNNYFGLRAVFDNHAYSNGFYGQFDISYTDGVITVTNNKEDDYFTTAVITVGSNIVTVDGTDFETALPAINRDGKVYVDKDAINAILKYELRRINLVHTPEYLEDGVQMRSFRSADFERKIPGCTHNDEDIKYYSIFYYY